MTAEDSQSDCRISSLFILSGSYLNRKQEEEEEKAISLEVLHDLRVYTRNTICYIVREKKRLRAAVT